MRNYYDSNGVIMECDCKQPGYCPHYKMNLVGRLWEIAKGINVDPLIAAQHREKWAARAEKSTVIPAKRKVREVTANVAQPKRKPCNCRRRKVSS